MEWVSRKDNVYHLQGKSGPPQRKVQRKISKPKVVYCTYIQSPFPTRPAQLARVLSRSPLMATAFPAKIAAVGTVKVAPEEAVRTCETRLCCCRHKKISKLHTRPPAAVKEAAVMGSKVGAGAAMEGAKRARQASRIKPWVR